MRRDWLQDNHAITPPEKENGHGPFGTHSSKETFSCARCKRVTWRILDSLSHSIVATTISGLARNTSGEMPHVLLQVGSARYCSEDHGQQA